MRYHNADKVVQLALEMQASRLGLTLDDIQSRFAVKRRTAQRMRDAVLRLFPQSEELVDPDRRKRWRIPTQTTGTPRDVTAEEIADLEAAAAMLRRDNQLQRAKSIERVAAKLKASLRPEVAVRLEPDVEALLEAEGLAMRPGPRPIIKAAVVDAIRLAIKQGREVYVAHRNRETRRLSGRRVQPYGFLFGNRHYLVAVSPDRHPDQARLYSLSNIERARILEAPFVRDPGFSLRRFAENAFGVFQEAPHDIVWRFAPEAAEAAKEYQFHPSQTLEEQADGSLVARFRAGGLREMCWHLFTWGGAVEVLAPPELIALYQELRP